MMTRLMRFSLRTLLIGISAVCYLLAYEVNWIHNRREFIAEQGAKGAYSEAIRSRWPRSVNNVNQPAEGAYRQAPSWLEWFGERGYHHIAIIIPESDTANRRLGVGSVTLDTLNNHPDYVRAQRLFPEATIYPCVVNGSEAYDVNVKDSVTGKVITGQVYWGDDVWDDTMQQELDSLRERLANK
jgi:hypothetical protein